MQLFVMISIYKRYFDSCGIFFLYLFTEFTKTKYLQNIQKQNIYRTYKTKNRLLCKKQNKMKIRTWKLKI